MIDLEFYGMARQRAGRSELRVEAGTLGEALAVAVRECPGLDDVRQPDGSLAGHYLLSLDGREFLGDLKHPLQSGDRVLLLGADAGG